jgi:hypothetical protein
LSTLCHPGGQLSFLSHSSRFMHCCSSIVYDRVCCWTSCCWNIRRGLPLAQGHHLSTRITFLRTLYLWASHEWMSLFSSLAPAGQHQSLHHGFHPSCQFWQESTDVVVTGGDYFMTVSY